MIPRALLVAGAIAGLLGALPGCGGGSGSDVTGGDVVDARSEVAAETGAEAIAPDGLGDALGDAAEGVPEVQRQGPFGVGVKTLTLIDPSRPTPANGAYAGAPERTLVTELWYPAPAGIGTPEKPVVDAPYEPASEPQPLVAYLHGFMSGRQENARAAALLASRGFVVAAPDGPLTRLQAPGGADPADVLNIPGDARYVIDQVLALGLAEPADGLWIDADRLGIVGISLGSLAALLSGFKDEYRDPRLKVVAAVAAPGCYLPAGFFEAHELPLFHGTLDAVLPYEIHGLPTFETAHAPKWLVRAAGGTHAGIAGTAAVLADHFENPDLVSCHAMSTNANASGERLAELAEAAGGGTTDEILARCGIPCPSDELPPALGALRQVAILERALVAFLLGTLGGEPAFLDYLETGLPAECPEASVQALK